jgi:hypothetical protein
MTGTGRPPVIPVRPPWMAEILETQERFPVKRESGIALLPGHLPVIPVPTGIQYRGASGCCGAWVPAFAGMTRRDARTTGRGRHTCRHSRASGNPVGWTGRISCATASFPRTRESSTAGLRVRWGLDPRFRGDDGKRRGDDGKRRGDDGKRRGKGRHTCRHSRARGNPVGWTGRISCATASFPRKRESSTAVHPGAVAPGSPLSRG